MYIQKNLIIKDYYFSYPFLRLKFSVCFILPSRSSGWPSHLPVAVKGLRQEPTIAIALNQYNFWILTYFCSRDHYRKTQLVNCSEQLTMRCPVPTDTPTTLPYSSGNIVGGVKNCKGSEGQDICCNTVSSTHHREAAPMISQQCSHLKATHTMTAPADMPTRMGENLTRPHP